MRILGMISGTSHDGIDAAVVDFQHQGTALLGSVVHTQSTPYTATLRARLGGALPPARTTMSEVCELDTLIGQAFARAAVAAIDTAGPVDAICSHGQTVYHWIQGGSAFGTLQLGQPAWLAEATGVPVISDLRIRDITAGGQGAPLVALLDQMLLATGNFTRAALNLGGISNVTVVAPDGTIVAYDIGPANALIDAVVTDRGLDPVGYDRDGLIAAAGRICEPLLRKLLEEPYYRLPPPKSTGKELFHGGYVQDALDAVGITIDDADLVATLTELTVQTVAAEVRASGSATVVASGGGCRNPVILEGLRRVLPGVSVILSDELGAPVDDKEAIAFALIGWYTMHGLPASVATGTGAREGRVLGTITPGAGALRLPEPVPEPPTSLILTANR